MAVTREGQEGCVGTTYFLFQVRTCMACFEWAKRGGSRQGAQPPVILLPMTVTSSSGQPYRR